MVGGHKSTQPVCVACSPPRLNSADLARLQLICGRSIVAHSPVSPRIPSSPLSHVGYCTHHLRAEAELLECAWRPTLALQALEADGTFDEALVKTFVKDWDTMTEAITAFGTKMKSKSDQHSVFPDTAPGLDRDAKCIRFILEFESPRLFSVCRHQS